MTSPRLPGLRIAQTFIATLVGVAAMSALGMAADPTTRPVTFSRDVAPILQEMNQRPGSAVPDSRKVPLEERRRSVGPQQLGE